jgi:hypothetical protein
MEKYIMFQTTNQPLNHHDPQPLPKLRYGPSRMLKAAAKKT